MQGQTELEEDEVKPNGKLFLKEIRAPRGEKYIAEQRKMRKTDPVRASSADQSNHSWPEQSE